ncbi:hypothetical protein L3X38_017166 [Prunus dulcis]|uniref:Uncharacterized protein n=1 Tax=Prunus dulcis TaxID=3755 RepID=A0AAD4W6L9_PRUDU|nr:hypothetical protein L3X38_017166 [Prunus dulcis]
MMYYEDILLIYHPNVLALPAELSQVHDVFYVSMLRKYMPDPHVLEYQPVDLEEDLSYEEQHVQILDRKEQMLRSRSIPVVTTTFYTLRDEENFVAQNTL